MKKYYIVYNRDINDNFTIYCFSKDYYYARRIINKLEKENIYYYFKEITISKILENSQFTR